MLALLTSRWTLYGALLAGLIAGALWWGHTRERAGEAKVQARWDAWRVTQHEQFQKDAGHAVTTYQLELGSGADLAPLRPMFVYHPPVYADEGAATEGACPGPAATAGVQPVPARDIAGDLDTLMRAADAVSARARAIQGLH